MMNITEPSQIAQAAAAGAAALVGLAFGLQKVLKSWKETGAETSVISLMHAELERLSKHNSTLATELHNLQTQLLNLNRNLIEVTAENTRLREEIQSLKEHLERFNSTHQDHESDAE